MKAPTAWLFLVLCLAAVADNLTGWVPFAYAAAACLLAFVAIEFRAAPRPHQIVGAVLIVAGLAAGAYVGALGETAFVGFRRAMQFLVLWAAVLWLRMPPERSPSFRAMRAFVGGQPPGRRYLILALAGNFVGGTLNLAGVSLLSGLITAATDPATRRRLTQALMRGFLAASCWSPFYVAVAVILVVIPVRWVTVAPIGMVMSLTLIGYAWTLDRLTRSAVPPAAAAPEPAPRLDAVNALRLAFIAVALFASVLGGTEALGVSVPITLGLVGPPFAIVWTFVHAEAGSFRPLVGEMARRVMESFPTLRGEALIFLGATIFGTGIAAALPPEAVGRAIETLAIPVDALIVLLVMAMALLGSIGMHPVLMAVVVGTVVPPEALGLSPEAMALLLLAMWGGSVTVSPFSATTLLLARIVGVSGWTVGWRWNAGYGFSSAFLIALGFVAFRHLAG